MGKMNQTFVAEMCQVFALPWHKFKVSDIIRTPVHNIITCSLVWFSDPFCMGGAKREEKVVVNKQVIHNCIPAGSVDEGKKQMSRRCES